MACPTSRPQFMVAPKVWMPFPKVLMFRTQFRCHLLQEAFLGSALHSYTGKCLL